MLASSSLKSSFLLKQTKRSSRRQNSACMGLVYTNNGKLPPSRTDFLVHRNTCSHYVQYEEVLQNTTRNSAIVARSARIPQAYPFFLVVRAETTFSSNREPHEGQANSPSDRLNSTLAPHRRYTRVTFANISTSIKMLAFFLKVLRSPRRCLIDPPIPAPP